MGLQGIMHGTCSSTFPQHHNLPSEHGLHMGENEYGEKSIFCRFQATIRQNSNQKTKYSIA